MEILTPVPLPPAIPLPGSFQIPESTISEPSIKPLEWEPVVIYPEDVLPPAPNPSSSESEEETEEEEEGRPNSEEKNDEALDSAIPELAEVQTITLPIIGVEVPVPRTEILATAATTAGISSFVAVGGTLFATTLFRQLQPLLKPIFKAVFKKLAKVRKKPPPLTYARQRLLERRQRRVGKTVSRG